MTTAVDRTSRLYGHLQTAVLLLFAVVVFWQPAPVLFESAASRVAGDGLRGVAGAHTGHLSPLRRRL